MKEAHTIEVNFPLDKVRLNCVKPVQPADFDSILRYKEEGTFDLIARSVPFTYSESDPKLRKIEADVCKTLLQRHISEELERVEAVVAKEKSEYNARNESRDDFEEVDCCPICLDEMPPQNCWKDGNYEFLCCGKRLCGSCAGTRVQRAKKATQTLTSPGPLEIKKSAKYDVDIHNRCPCCGSALPQPGEQVPMVENHMTKNKGWAFRRMGRIFHDGEFGKTPDKKKAFELFKRGAELGDMAAMYNVAVMYNRGDDVPVSMSQALHWYQQLTLHGHAMGQYRLATHKADDGKTRVLDPSESYRLFTLSSAQGCKDAMEMLGNYYLQAQIKTKSIKDFHLRMYWFSRAAEMGSVQGTAAFAHSILYAQATIWHRPNTIYDLVPGLSAYPLVMRLARRVYTMGDDRVNNMFKGQIDSMLGFLKQGCAGCGKRGNNFMNCSQW